MRAHMRNNYSFAVDNMGAVYRKLFIIAKDFD